MALRKFFKDKFGRSRPEEAPTPKTIVPSSTKPKRAPKVHRHSSIISADERIAWYTAQRNGGPLTPKQRRRLRHKVNARQGALGRK